MAKFRFPDLKIWQSAIQIADEVFDFADKLKSFIVLQSNSECSDVHIQ